MFCIKIIDKAHEEYFYLSYAKSLESYYILQTTNFNIEYSSTKDIMRFNTVKDAQNFINELEEIRNESANKKDIEYKKSFTDKLPSTLIVRQGLIFEVIPDNFLFEKG